MKRIIVATGFLATLLFSSFTLLAQSQSRSDILKEIEVKRRELAALEKTYLEPTEADRLRHAEFLKQSDTGLIRLLPREKFDSEVYRSNKKTITMRGGGAYYSFTRKTHEYGYGSDLSLDQDVFQVGFAGADYGFLTNLGDIPIGTVGPETPAVARFAAYKAAREEQVARTEHRRLAEGAKLANLAVKNRLPVHSNSTYLLRSINYSDSDVLVVFRVVRIDSDRSVIILWKLLKKYENPKLNRSQPVVVG